MLLVNLILISSLPVPDVRLIALIRSEPDGAVIVFALIVSAVMSLRLASIA